MTTVQVVRKEVEKIKENIMPKRRERIIINFWGECVDFWTGETVPCPEKPCPGR